MKNRFVFDLELEQPKSNHQCKDSLLDKEQIIQVGWCILDPEGNILESHCQTINIGVNISQFIQNLTGIKNEDIASGTTLETVYLDVKDAIAKYDCSRIPVQWGGGDYECLCKEVPAFRSIFGRSSLNVKHMYQVWAEVNGINSSGGLAKSLNRVGIGWGGGSKHNAEADAINTARMFHKLRTKLKEVKNEK